MTKDKPDTRKSSVRVTKKEDISKRFPKKEWATKLGITPQTSAKRTLFPDEVYILIDCSSSMADGTKMDQAKKGAIGFAEEAHQKGYAVGLITFAEKAEHVLPPQTKTRALFECIKSLNAGGSTNMTAALEIAVDELRHVTKGREKVICVVTDGEPNNVETALAVAREAHRMRIDILAIGTDDANLDFLEELATRKELSRKVSREQLGAGIASMAKMLPKSLDSDDSE